MAETKKMTQTAIIKELAETAGVNNKVSKQFMEALAQLAVRETKKNGVFILPGIGRLVRAERKARTGRNPATGEESCEISNRKIRQGCDRTAEETRRQVAVNSNPRTVRA
jgi:DNA-binding protein HU-beta